LLISVTFLDVNILHENRYELLDTLFIQ